MERMENCGWVEEKTENYRGVSLLDTGYKVMTSILKRRLRDWLEESKCWKESQAGFRKGRRTRNHIFTLNSLIGNGLKRKEGRLYVGLIDFRTAFDLIDRGKMIEKLKRRNGTENDKNARSYIRRNEKRRDNRRWFNGKLQDAHRSKARMPTKHSNLWNVYRRSMNTEEVKSREKQ